MNTITKSFDPLDTPVGDSSIREYLKTNIKNDVREIIRSYHQTYDHLTELLQNAVDVCENTFKIYKDGNLSGTYLPNIEITIDLLKNSISVMDNGTGMSKDHLTKYFFRPHASLKNTYSLPVSRLRGEKGVGATFLSYGSAWIEVSTKDNNGEISSCKLEGGIDWIMKEGSLDPPQAYPLDPPEILRDVSHGTIITLGFSDRTNIKILRKHGPDIDHWEKILRIFTAIGYVLPIEQRDDFFSTLTVNVKVIDENGISSKNISKGFLYPHEINGVQDIRLSQLSRGRQGKLPLTQMMKDCIWEFHSFNDIVRKISDKIDSNLSEALYKYAPAVYIVFVWSREFWDNTNQRCFRTRRKEFIHGLTFSTKTQRIGEQRELSFTWRSGDYNRVFILLDVKKLHADIGRKSVPSELRELGNEIANILHNDFYDNLDALKREPSRLSEQGQVELERLTDVVLSYTDLEGATALGIQIIKIPHEEQDVVALFFNLLGAGYLKGYNILATKTSTMYDGFAYFLLKLSEDTVYDHINNPLGIPSEKFGRDGFKISPERSLIEFKLSSDGLIRDIIQQNKRLSDIRWLVCWEIGNLHERENFDIVEITSEDQKSYREYYGVTHLLTDEKTNVHVICLKRVIEILRGLLTS